MDTQQAYFLLEIPNGVKPSDAYLKRRYFSLLNQRTAYKHIGDKEDYENTLQLAEDIREAYDYLLAIDYEQRPKQKEFEKEKRTMKLPKINLDKYWWLLLFTIPGVFVGIALSIIIVSFGMPIKKFTDEAEDSIPLRILFAIPALLVLSPTLYCIWLLLEPVIEKIINNDDPIITTMLWIVLAQNIPVLLGIRKGILQEREATKQENQKIL